MIRSKLICLIFVGLASLEAARPPREISEDRELKELDLSGWNCLNRLEGTAKTPDGVERNRLKNRAAGIPARVEIKALDTTSFLQHVSDFDAQTQGKRRKDLTSPQRQQLNALEKQVVSLTGYLVIAYAGPPESTNCGSVDPHDWHLELFEKPADHAPGVGDPTPIVCEITPRTQTSIYRDNIRLQALAAFIRAPDLSIEPTGHKAMKIRVTGYLLWDDDHNGKADVGTTIRTIARNGYHQPWRGTAWEIHPVLKIEALEAGTAPVEPTTGAAVKPSVAPSSSPETTPAPPPTSPPPTSTPTPQQFVTISQPVKIKIRYGETVLPRGTRLRVLARDAQTVTVEYLDGTPTIPISSTDLSMAPPQ